MADDLMALRRRVRPLLDLSAPRDALAAYYALHHDPARTQLHVEGKPAQADGFLAICQTGRDLFRLLAVLRARRVRTATALLMRGLLPLRPYYLVASPDMRLAVEEVLEITRTESNLVYELDLRRFSPAINVLVVPAPAPDGSPRFVIRSQGEVAAEAGTNWRSPNFAEIYVQTTPEAQGRGWGKAVVEACVSWVIRSGLQPLYIVSEDNEFSIRLAHSVGFVDTGARELAVEATVREEGTEADAAS
jgi:GNAT superfamily N-acetyltransferase